MWKCKVSFEMIQLAFFSRYSFPDFDMYFSLFVCASFSSSIRESIESIFEKYANVKRQHAIYSLALCSFQLFECIFLLLHLFICGKIAKRIQNVNSMKFFFRWVTVWCYIKQRKLMPNNVGHTFCRKKNTDRHFKGFFFVWKISARCGCLWVSYRLIWMKGFVLTKSMKEPQKIHDRTTRERPAVKRPINW